MPWPIQRSTIFKIVVGLLALGEFLDAAEYKVSAIGTALIPGRSFANSIESLYQCEDSFAINDYGHICSIMNNNEIYLSEEPSQLIIIASSDEYNTTNTILLNNNDQVVYSRGNLFLFWDAYHGTQLITAYPLKPDSTTRCTALNDLGQVVGKAGKDSFLWEKGKITDMGPKSEFAQNFHDQGYLATSISITALNNNGEIAGYFSFGKYNENQQEIVEIGSKPFFWNGTLHVIDCQQNTYSSKSVQMNNAGYVLINSNSTAYLWHWQKQIIKIPRFRAISMNDSNTLIGLKEDNHWQFTIWKNRAFKPVSSLLGHKLSASFNDLSNLSRPYSDTYEVEEICLPAKINNRGQIIALGKIWDKWHPCIIEPIEDSPDYIAPW